MVKNVVIVNDTACVCGGDSQVAMAAVEALRDAGLNVTYFAGTGQPDPVLEDVPKMVVGKCTFADDPFKVRGALRGLWCLETKRALTTILADFDPSDTIVHVHSWTHALSPSIFAAIHQAGFRAVVSVHDYFVACPNGGLFDFQQGAPCCEEALSRKCMLRNCDKRSYAQKVYRCVRYSLQRRALSKLDVSYAYIDEFVEKIVSPSCGFAPGYVLENPVTAFASACCDDTPGEDRDGFLYVGRVEREKGVELFCEAVYEGGFSATVVGDGSRLEVLKGRYPDIRFTGWLDARRIVSLYGTHKALVMPSLWFEPFGLVALEAQMTGSLPVVVPDESGIAPLVSLQGTGLLFERGSVESLKAAMCRLDDDTLLASLKASVRENLKRNINERSGRAYAGRAIRVYDRVLGS